MNLLDSFQYLNPFDDVAVHEDAVWGESDQSNLDVESIHADVSATLLDDLKHVTATTKTRVRFLVGREGLGKSHLFSRLRRHIGGQAVFVFASIPPSRPEALDRWLLGRVIAGLRHKAYENGQTQPYTQVDAFIYRLLIMSDRRLTDKTELEFHTYFQQLSDEAKQACLVAGQNKLADEGFDSEIVDTLFAVLKPERRQIALRWLSGSENLSEESLAILNHAMVLEDNKVRDVMVLIGKLAAFCKRPIVMVLDQLDMVTSSALIDIFQDFVFAVTQQSYSWYIVVSMLRERFEAWYARFNKPFVQRLAAQSTGGLPIVELHAFADVAQREELLMQRLRSHPLAEARRQRAILSSIYPLTETDIKGLVNSTAESTPRLLLRQASSIYNRRVSGKVAEYPLRSLSEVVAEAFDTRRGQIDESNICIEKASIADRVTEVIRLLALAHNIDKLEESLGSLEGSRLSDGTHNIFAWGDSKLEVIGHHVHNRRAFPDFAQKALKMENGALFVRSASAPVSGPASVQRFEELRQKHKCISLTNPVLADLEALMQLLADMRAGDFNFLETDPPFSPEAFMKAAAQLPILETLELAQAIRERLTRKSERPVTPVSPEPPRAVPPDPAAPVPANLESKIADIMQPVRWLAVERLCWLLQTQHGMKVDVNSVVKLVQTGGLQYKCEIYPPKVRSPGIPQILIYNEANSA